MAKKLFCLISILACGALVLLVTPAFASPATQSIDYTPTPDDSGRIVYRVRANDTCLSIALRFLGGDVNTLRTYNNLDEQCALTTGQELLLGVYQPPSPTPGPSPTPTPILPTPTPFNGSGKVCILLFADINGNALAETGEGPIPSGAVSITDKEGKVSLTGNTGAELLCFKEVPEGEYNISVAPPQGFNATTIMNYPLKLLAGEEVIIDFGAQAGSALAPTSSPSEGGPGTTGRSPVLAIAGIALVLGGIGLAVYMVFLMRKQNKS